MHMHILGGLQTDKKPDNPYDLQTDKQTDKFWKTVLKVTIQTAIRLKKVYRQTQGRTCSPGDSQKDR